MNEHAPKFNKEFYTFKIDENTLPNTTIDYLIANDEDGEESVYGQVHYELKNGQNR